MTVNELANVIKALESPLRFASKNNFSNLSRLKNLNDIIDEIYIKVDSSTLNNDLKEKLFTITSLFSEYDTLDNDNKISIINKGLELISEVKNEVNEDINYPVTDGFSEQEGKNGAKLSINEDVRYIKGVGPWISSVLSKKNIRTIDDLIFYFPRKYEDRRNIQKISTIKTEGKYIVIGEVISNGIIRKKGGKIFKVTISDGTGMLALVWFRGNEKYIKNTYRKGVYVVVSGEITYSKYDRMFQIIHPRPEDIESYGGPDEISGDSLHFNRIVPVYPLTEGLTQKRIRTVIKGCIDSYADEFEDTLPDSLIKKSSLIPLSEALREVHFPEKYDPVNDFMSSEEIYSSAPHRTVAYYEFFLLELGLALNKSKLVKSEGISFNTEGEILSRFVGELPFKLTESQKRVVREIKDDMKNKFPMNRLIQGDVGSGKTIVSIISMLVAVNSGYQATIMAPTEILAEQHFISISNYLDHLDLNIVLLKSALSKREKNSALKMIKSGSANIVVGTHALIEENVEFNRLGLVVIDEQHRFGVLQRSMLIGKSQSPDVLVMTATPIPRTLAITVYGDLDVSSIDELPPGRKKIDTYLYRDTEKNRKEIYKIIRAEVEKGRQGYVVCPFIDESENVDFKHVNHVSKVYDALSEDIFPDFNIGLLHGRMLNEEKEMIMNKFISGDINILVSTTVIEVGVDVGNATFMVIENAERYGLSQLHQLRGRIGRSELDSSCILIADYKQSEDSKKKLSMMVRTTDGFKIAEEDLKIRGPGDFLGTKQSGIPQFKFANLIRDWKVLTEARKSAFEIIKTDPELSGYPKLRENIEKKFGELLKIKAIS